MPALLFIDDDIDILESSKAYFTKLGYQVFCIRSARQALDMISSAALSCIILDIAMPDLDGFSFCKRLREVSRVPVIFLSGLTEDEARIKSFMVGGDDYMCKPFNIKELELRIQARIRDADSLFRGETLQFGDLKIDTGRRLVSYKDKNGDFTTLQFDVLAFLARHPGQVYSYEQLYDLVWKTPIVGSRHNLQVVIACVLQKLNALCDSQVYIETIPRKGYRFVESPSDHTTL